MSSSRAAWVRGEPPRHQDRLRVWVLSAYHTGSHRAWAQGYARFSRHHIVLLTMTGRFWKWRMQGGSVELAAQAPACLAHEAAPDVVMATDMVNLLLPNRLSYPELIPASLHPACLYTAGPDGGEELFQMAVHRLTQPRPAPPSLQAHIAGHYGWSAVAARYDSVVEGLVATGHGHG